jgi:hypothetical protein
MVAARIRSADLPCDLRQEAVKPQRDNSASARRLVVGDRESRATHACSKSLPLCKKTVENGTPRITTPFSRLRTPGSAALFYWGSRPFRYLVVARFQCLTGHPSCSGWLHRCESESTESALIVSLFVYDTILIRLEPEMHLETLKPR